MQRFAGGETLDGIMKLSPTALWFLRQFTRMNVGLYRLTGGVVGGKLAGCPLLFGALATFECSKEANVTSGDHVVFFGRVERATYREGEPLIFSAGRYGTHAFLD